MDTSLYLRPREKLQTKGVSALTVVELLQVILGSGNSQVSAATIARLVEKLIIDDAVSFRTLTAIQGVGEAKACQILAVVELAKRSNVHE